MKRCFLLLSFLVLCLSTRAKGDISLFVQEALGASGEATSAGHAAIYFTNICAETPVKLRLCKEGEMGTVINNYADFGTDRKYEWMATPVVPYLYGVENESDAPLYINREIRTLLRETYRKKHLLGYVPTPADGSLPPGSWWELIGTLFNRDIYAFTLRTSLTEDTQFLERFNRSENRSRFNAMHKNCADFGGGVINSYFAGAAYRDWVNDFAVTTPKAVARSLTRYASKHPERMYHVTKYTQYAGPIRRSLANRHFTEKFLVSKRYAVPIAVFQPQILAVFAIAYSTTGWFSINGEYKKRPGPEIAQLNLSDRQPRGSRSFTDSTEIAEKRKAIREQQIGTSEDWTRYKENLIPVMNHAIDRGCFADANEVKTFFKDLELQSDPAFDENGAVFLKVRAYGENKVLGITRDNILSVESDPHLAHKLMLAKVSAELNGWEQNRSSFPSFKDDWELLMKLSAMCEARSNESHAASRKGVRFLETPEALPTGQKLKVFFAQITK